MSSNKPDSSSDKTQKVFNDINRWSCPKGENGSTKNKKIQERIKRKKGKRKFEIRE